ncbi:Recombination initiation defects 3, putative isoform 1 [Theobroma cacao]|uniref:Recombination initiation defects 3, putative isoform 1 n=1 Tax=Theobroma cacao TaxID=3641 RepID=A0A061DV47_THECC|nr:Recombination initiation defects 3, putative isoform 1 [Theobroma cacao]EOX95954.1 Recombination initiation defects 3, putative isoform 1 [Theobroma cacao]
MKLKINKACDLSSISVLPPHTRRSSLVPSGPQSSQLRSQPSQQSFSQGISSQHALFSQISQSSLDEVVTTDQRYGSQERENSVKKFSCLPPTNFTREDSQIPISKTSTNLIRKWNSASNPEHRCQSSQELEHRLSMVETSLNRFGMILDSIQSDVMQVNKGTKEVLLEMERIRQKLIAEDTFLQLLNNGQEDIKASLDGGMKAISDQLNKDIYRDKLQQIFLVLSALPEQTEASLLKLQTEICNTFTNVVKGIASNVKTLGQKGPVGTSLQPKCTSCATPQSKPQPVMKQAVPPKVYEQPTLAPKVETGGWKSVKMKQSTINERAFCKENKRKGVSSIEQEKYRILIESDEEMDGGFSCLLDDKERNRTNSLIKEAKEETERILRKARRRKRKSQNFIIIN